MAQATISLSTKNGDVHVRTEFAGHRLECAATADNFRTIQESASELISSFESGYRPFVDPMALSELGRQLGDKLLPTGFLLGLLDVSTAKNTRLLFSSPESALLNLPWELLPGLDGQFLVSDARWSIRRTVRESLSASTTSLVPPPLRVLFAACAPTDLTGLDYEKEEEAILRITNQLGAGLHLDFAETGTFEELRDLISEYQPHIVHLSGHSSVSDGIGSFAFENERGTLDSRDAREMAEQLFAGRAVRMVFVNGCQTAQAAATGVCQTLTATGYVPLALGWGASIADDRATDFTRVFFHELAAGQPIDLAASTARRDLLARCREQRNGSDILDASFALPQVYAADASDELVDRRLQPQPPARPGVRYELLGDNIRGLREGFVGRRRLLQNTRPALRSGEKNILLLTGIGGAGKSTFATRLANRFVRDGYRIVALQAGRKDAAQFCLRMVTELAMACQRLGREADERLLLDGNRPLDNRLRLAVEVLNEAKLLLVLDNLEALMPLPPASPVWEIPEFDSFFRELTARLTGQGRAILTCRYLPEDLDATQPNLVHQQMPEFTEADFFKYLGRRERVRRRIDRGELSQDLLEKFYRKLGATPRFLEQASAILSTIDANRLMEQLETLSTPEGGASGIELWQLQQDYFRDLFLPQLYEALPARWRLALSRLALMQEALPLDGVLLVGGLESHVAEEFIRRCLSLTLLQRFGEGDEVDLFAIYPLQREFLIQLERLPSDQRREAHSAAAAFLRRSFEQDREQELRLHFMTELLACLHHATEAVEIDTRVWATTKISLELIRHAEYTTALALLEPLLSEIRPADIVRLAARCALATGEWRRARRLTQEEQSQRQEIGDRAGEASTWHELATIDLREGNYAGAREKFEKSQAIVQAIGHRAGEAATWHQLATIDLIEGNSAGAREKFEKSLTIEHEIGNRIGEAATWHQLATIELEGGNYAGAREKFEKSQTIRQAIGDRAGEAGVWHQLATIDFRQANYAEARKKFEKSLAINQAIANRAGEAATWHQLATIDLEGGNYAEAREKFEKSLTIRQAIGDRAGEAVTFYQLGILAWRVSHRNAGIRLVALCFIIDKAIGSGRVKKTLEGLLLMAEELKLAEAEINSLVDEAFQEYQRDRGAALVQNAFAGF